MLTETAFANQVAGAKHRTLSVAQRWGWMLFSIFVIVALIEPAYFAENQGNSIHLLFSISRYIAAACVVFLYVLQRPKLSKFIFYCIFFEATLLFSTCVNSANVMDWVRDGAYVVVFALFLQAIMKISPELLLRSLSMVLGSYVNINTLCEFIYPQGMYRQFSTGVSNCWFLGYDNAACTIIVVAITVSLFRIFLYRDKRMIWDWSVVLCGIWFIFSLQVATCIVAIVCFFLFMVLTRFARIRAKIGNARLIVVGMIGLFLFLQFFFTQQNGLFSLLFLVLHKSSNFTGRAPLWREAWSELGGAKIIFGLGVHDSSEYLALFRRSWSFHLHCYYLQVIYEGGLVAFGALLGWMLYVGGCFNKESHRYCAMVFLAGLLAFMVLWQAEANASLVRYFVIILFLLYNAKEFETLGQRVRPRRWRLIWGAFR